MSFDIIINGSEANTSILLADKANGTYAEVYAFGALLNAFLVRLASEELNVIDGFISPADARENITNGFKSAKLSPFVCRLKNEKYHFAENHFHVNKFKLGKHAIHGLIYDAVFSVVDHKADENGAYLKLEYVYDNDNDGYPFCYRCDVEYKLETNNKLTLTTTITNIDEQLIPVSDGWHPYFTLGAKVNECQLEFQSKEMVEFDEELIPTGNLLPYQEFGSLAFIGDAQLDNCFTLNFAECQPLCVLRNIAKKIQLEIHPAHAYPYLQIYTPDHRNSIAIENLSSAPDAFNNAIGLKVLEPKESAIFTTRYIITHL